MTCPGTLVTPCTSWSIDCPELVTPCVAFTTSCPPTSTPCANAHPVATSITPPTGPVSGGTSVVIHGRCLATVTKVSLGTTQPSATQLISVLAVATRIDAVTLSQAAGTYTLWLYTVTSGWRHQLEKFTFLATPSLSCSGASTGSTKIALSATGSGWWRFAANGAVSVGGDAVSFGTLPASGIAVSDIVGGEVVDGGEGYFLVGADGGIFGFGSASREFVGSLPQRGIAVSDIVGMVAIQGGYYLAGADGGVFAFGSAMTVPFYGSLPSERVAVSDVVGISSYADCHGYYLVGRDGGVFAFGEGSTDFDGSLPALSISVADVVQIVPLRTGGGYYLVGRDGGVFAFGAAGYVGSLGGDAPEPIVDLQVIARSPDDQHPAYPPPSQYVLVGADGATWLFG